MNVYQTDFDGVFVGVTTADRDQMDHTNWLIPAGCITTSPPDYNKGQLARWNGSAWAVETAPEEETGPETPSTPTKDIITRSERNELLSASDWTQVADSPVDRNAWATYRQLLRNVPAQAGFPASVTWPVEPS